MDKRHPDVDAMARLKTLPCAVGAYPSPRRNDKETAARRSPVDVAQCRGNHGYRQADPISE